MAKPQITMVTKEDLEAVKVQQSVETAKPKASVSQQDKPYFTRIPQKDFLQYFKKFDVISCDYVKDQDNNPQFVFVECKDFQIAFSDYDFTILLGDPSESINIENPQFDYEAFLQYADSIEKTPIQILSELVAVELLGQRFESYNAKKKQHDLNRNKKSFESLSPKMKKTLALINEQKENEINSRFNKTYYGNYAGPQSYNKDAE